MPPNLPGDPGDREGFVPRSLVLNPERPSAELAPVNLSEVASFYRRRLRNVILCSRLISGEMCTCWTGDKESDWWCTAEEQQSGLNVKVGENTTWCIKPEFGSRERGKNFWRQTLQFVAAKVARPLLTMAASYIMFDNILSVFQLCADGTCGPGRGNCRARFYHSCYRNVYHGKQHVVIIEMKYIQRPGWMENAAGMSNRAANAIRGDETSLHTYMYLYTYIGIAIYLYRYMYLYS